MAKDKTCEFKWHSNQSITYQCVLTKGHAGEHSNGCCATHKNLQPEPKTCEWARHRHRDPRRDEMWYEAACNNAAQCLEKRIRAIGHYEFCPFCGGKIVEVKDE